MVFLSLGANAIVGCDQPVDRTLVTTELNGEIVMRPLTAEDAQRAGFASERQPRGTVVELTVPISEE